jgi:hypothetical protein
MESEWSSNEPTDNSELDEFNDETFGVDVNELGTDWEQPPAHQLAAVGLPEFFKTQQTDAFLEESLEEDPTLKGELLPSDETHFPTQNEDYTNEEFFFLDTETEANAV